MKAHIKAGDPVISVDTKKELAGEFRNPGRTWRRRGESAEVNVHGFPHLAHGKVAPYGCDIARNRAVVNGGVSHDTVEFAVESIRRCWRLDGGRICRDSRRLLICADSGGATATSFGHGNSACRALRTEIAMPITVCHYPPGTSKWNEIDHRLFSFISLNWRGRLLVNYETVVDLIGATKTRTGPRVKAVLDTGTYHKGVKIEGEAMREVRLQKHRLHPDWNHTIDHQGSS